MLTTREHFKIGVLTACTERGLTLEETHEVVKAALANLEDPQSEKQAGVLDVLGRIAGGTGRVLSKGMDVGMTAAKGLGAGLILAPVGIGAAGGYMLGRGKGKLSDEDLEEVKQRELIEAYSRATEDTQRKSMISARKRQRRSTPVRPLI